MDHMDGDLFGTMALLTMLPIVLLILLIPTIFFLLTLQRALARCEPSSRTMTPGQVWLLLVPIFNLAWIFLVVNALSDSLHREFTRRGIPVTPNPGKSIGLAYAILSLLSAVPLVGFLTGLPACVCWILYWVEIARYSGRLDLQQAASVSA
jgi:hypothetical protein